MNGYKRLMTAVLTQQISDYVKAVKVFGPDFSKVLKKERVKIKDKKSKDCDPKQLRDIEMMTKGEDAEYYIFADSEESEGYVFGFKFICSYIGLDPGKFRKRIKEKRKEFWKDIYGYGKRTREM